MENNIFKSVAFGGFDKQDVIGYIERTAREAAEALAPLTRSEVVQVIGTKFVLYRPSHKKDKKDKIILVSDRKR